MSSPNGVVEQTNPLEEFGVADLQISLIEMMERVKRGKVSASTANAYFNGAQKLMTTVKYQLDYAKMTGRLNRIPIMEKNKTGAQLTKNLGVAPMNKIDTELTKNLGGLKSPQVRS